MRGKRSLPWAVCLLLALTGCGPNAAAPFPTAAPETSPSLIVPETDWTELEPGLSAAAWEGDYGFDRFLAQGGAASDREVMGFLQQELLGGDGGLSLETMGRMNAWLGPDGKGLMDAFNPADLDMAAQPMGRVSVEEIEGVIGRYTAITDRYELAMPSAAANGVDYTANVITQPERFHILSGRTCTGADEVVLTEFVAADLGVSVGDTVTLSADLGSGEYTVSGIYQCANDMGANIGLSREGFAKIGSVSDPRLWCIHYFLEDPKLQPEIVAALEDTFGHDVHVHENSWPGLFGIIAAMRTLLAAMYGTAAVFILVVTALTSHKLLVRERKDLSILRAVGFSVGALRAAFALRFAGVALIGAALGVLFSGLLTDPIVAAVMRLCGISNFSSRPGLDSVLLPAAVMTALFAVFAWLAAGKIRRMKLTELIAQG